MSKLIIALVLCGLSCTALAQQYDALIRNGLIVDGSGGKPYAADVAINADTIAFIGKLPNAKARQVIDAKGKIVTPGFVNMLSWGVESLIVEGLAMSDITQGVTLNVFGEGWSMGPLNDKMKAANNILGLPTYRYQINWTTLGGYMRYLEQRGVSTNIASFVGAATPRIYVIGYENRAPTAAELEKMCQLVRTEMEQGAMGIGSSLIYAPGFYAGTDELTALCKAAGEYGGMYISHMRSEGNKIETAMDELIQISKAAGVPAEIYHWKIAGKQNWYKTRAVIAKVDSARKAGLPITADMYNYTAGGTGLFACMPPWVQAGGTDAWIERMKDPVVRKQVIQEMNENSNDWENFYFSAGPENIIISGLQQDSLKRYLDKNLVQVGQMMGLRPEEAAMELVTRDRSGVSMTVFLMNDSNINRMVVQPYVSFGSDAESISKEGVFIENGAHPRTYGNVPRVFTQYVQKGLISLPEAIRKLSYLPCQNMKVKKRGLLKVGFYADINVFNPQRFTDHATYAQPHQYSTGMDEVLVNGVWVLRHGQHTGAMPGRFVKGPGYGIKK